MQSADRQRILTYLSTHFVCECTQPFKFENFALIGEGVDYLISEYVCPRCGTYYRSRIPLRFPDEPVRPAIQSDSLLFRNYPGAIRHGDLETADDPYRKREQISAEDVLRVREWVSKLNIHKIKRLVRSFPQSFPQPHQIGN